MDLTPTELALVYRGLARLEEVHRPQLFQDSYDVHELTVQLQQRVKRELEKNPHSRNVDRIRQFLRYVGIFLLSFFATLWWRALIR
jgi:hypothetical protein